MQNFCLLILQNMVVRNFDVVSDKLNFVSVCGSANYTQKWATKFSEAFQETQHKR
jgi:hypothetical protein